jgi:UDP-N-acetylmuramoyl-L-alanyl-D-glutamate--2,6-diaminopimelate ligase
MIRQITLSSLLEEFPLKVSPIQMDDTVVNGIAIDSRQVQPGNLFVALKGASADGHDFIPNAIARGASAIAGDQDIGDLSVPYIKLENSRQAISWLAAAFYGYPARKMTMVGVTGTDGKTTTCNLLYKILSEAGIKAGLISTVNAVIGKEVLDTGFHVTTPDAQDVQRYLARMVEAGLTHAILETTSHGWAQYRVDACEFDVGVVTNITHEHLDEHGSYENYRSAKARLFQSLEKTAFKPQGNPRLSVLNRDDLSYGYLSQFARGSQVSYGLDQSADVRAVNVEPRDGVRFDAIGKGFNQRVTSGLRGAYNVSNCLAAMTAAIYGLGLDPATAARGVSHCGTIPGRWEQIDFGQKFIAVVDFAHTPNALSVVIDGAKDVSQKRVIVIFGSAGLRDREKRRLMAEVAVQKADISILTAEDPRTESLEDILEEMAEGARSKGGVEGKTYWRIADRGEAIRTGVHLAKAGDIVIACGKGHEQSMCFGTTEYPWDDRTAMRAALAELMGVDGPQMPSLPTSVKKHG